MEKRDGEAGQGELGFVEKRKQGTREGESKTGKLK